jgi:3-oxoacyl-[acyl-carrier-protein] synthase II
MRRVVITGLGMVSPLGCNVDNSWKGLLDCKSGVSQITKFDTTDYQCKIAGEVKYGTASNQFNPLKYVEERDLKKMDPFIIFAIAAAEEAISDSGWIAQTEQQKYRTGVLIGSGIGGLETIEKFAVTLKLEGPKRISPFFIPSCLINLASGQISIRHGFMGPNQSVVTACSTGAHAIGDAARIIKYGGADVMISGGAEAPICTLGVAGFQAAKTLSTKYNDSPEKASRPWDEGRDGFIMGEGSAILVLEEYEHAKARGAKIYAEIIGYGSSGDAYHITSPHPEGIGAKLAMSCALQDANINSEDIDYINAHGTSTNMGDQIELDNVQQFFSKSLDKLSMSSTKSSIGHLLGAAGCVEAIFSVLALRDMVIPATLNLDNPPENCIMDLVANQPKEREIRYSMSNSFGFGGTNASLIFKKFNSK